MHYVCIQDISVFQLSTFRTEQLRSLSKRIAESHIAYIDQASATNLEIHVQQAHEFGISLDLDKRRTLDSNCKRLCDSEFWFRRLAHISDKTRETIAVRNLKVGNPANGLEPYCSNESLDIYLERQFGRSARSLFCLQKDIERVAHSSYLISKALCEQAFDSGYLSVLITLGLDGRYHSSCPNYQGLVFDDAHEALHGIYERLLEGLSRQGLRGKDFFGMRCIEVHVDGCPHWHLVIYLRKDLLPYLTERLRALHYRHSKTMGHYFDAYSSRIVQVQEPTDLTRYSAAVSYIFKNSYAGRAGNTDHFMDAVRQKVAISIYGKRQYDFIGMSGSRSVIRELRRHQSVGGVADELVLSRGQHNREERQYSAIKALVNGELSSYHLIKNESVNRYGEKVLKVIGVFFLEGFSGKEALAAPICPGVIRNYSSIERYEEDVPTWLPISILDLNFCPRAPPNIPALQQV